MSLSTTSSALLGLAADLVLTVLAFAFPPLAVWVKRGIFSLDTWIAGILTLLGWIPGIAYALFVVWIKSWNSIWAPSVI
ncbi:hypothetical protein DFJ74DRAFT_709817 [Hyaloraphidium curvatum]|nr:hypothetical protein DFJ74DRAFT_709817 [Hyaloraphidium curvatum]